MSEIEVTLHDREERAPRRGRAGAGRRWRAATAMSLMLVRRGAWRDRGVLTASVVLVAVSALLAVVAPRLVLDVVDGGARDVLTDQGDRAEMVVRASVGNSGSAVPGLRGELFEQFVRAAGEVEGNLPPTLARVAGDISAAVMTPRTEVTTIETPRPHDDAALDDVASGDEPAALEETTWRGDRVLQVLALDVGAPADSLVRVVEGELPGAPRPATSARSLTDVAVTAPVAEALGLQVGTQVRITVHSGAATWLHVVGIVEALDANEPTWRLAPEALVPHTFAGSQTSPALARGTVLASAAGAAELASALDQPSTGTVRIAVRPEAFDTATAAAVVDEVQTVRSQPTTLVPALRHATFAADFATHLAQYPARARAALAQMSVVAAGVVGVAAVVIGLLARLLVTRRAGRLALERARGATVTAVTARLVVESLAVTALGVGLGVGVSQLLVEGLAGTALPLGAVALASLASAPVIGALTARATWTGRREPANRQDRARLARRRRVRRLVVEATVVVLAAAGVVALRGRGVLQSTTQTIDPFLAVTPLLLCLAVTLLVVRVFPAPVRAVGRLARRGRGALGLLGAATSARAVAMLPLLALTLGVGITTASGLLAGTVNAGQEAAAWERVGADARFDAPLPPADLAALRAADGVTHVVEGIVAETSIDLGPVSDRFTVVAVERELLEVLAATPGTDPASLAPAFEPVADDEPLAMVVDPSIAARMSGEDVSMYFGPAFLTARLAGTTTVSLRGYAEGPFVFLDLAQVDARMSEPRDRTTVWVTGPGTDGALEALDLAPLATSRTGWLEANRGSALVGGVQDMLRYAAATVAFLAATALVATVLAGARSRGVVLSMLRTLGLRAGYGWWLALAELVPVVLAALVGGVLAGSSILLLLGPALGLGVLTGGVGEPTLVVEPTFVLAVAGAVVVLLGVAVLAEVLAHRRDRLSEVLRVGVTS